MGSKCVTYDWGSKGVCILVLIYVCVVSCFCFFFNSIFFLLVKNNKALISWSLKPGKFNFLDSQF